MPSSSAAIAEFGFARVEGLVSALVPLHRDMHIPVARQVVHPSLRGWSSKEGMLFVQPPREVLDALLAVRVHPDACSADDGALEVVPGSHRDERIDAGSADRARATLEAGKGDALLMRPLVLHASRKATGNSLRRVLHFVFGPGNLPHGLEWRNWRNRSGVNECRLLADNGHAAPPMATSATPKKSARPMLYLRTELATDFPEPSTWWQRRFAIDTANPSYRGQYHRIKCWLIEFDDDGNPWREIGLDAHGSIVIAGPSKRDYGFWLDTNMRYSDFAGEPVTQAFFERMWTASGVVAP